MIITSSSDSAPDGFPACAPGSDETGTEPEYSAERVSRIIMSPIHAKAFAARIHEAVQGWERRYGRLPQDGE